MKITTLLSAMEHSWRNTVIKHACVECEYLSQCLFACLPFSSFLQIFKSVGSDETVQGQGSRRLISFSLSGMFCSPEGLVERIRMSTNRQETCFDLTLTHKLLIISVL